MLCLGWRGRALHVSSATILRWTSKALVVRSDAGRHVLCNHKRRRPDLAHRTSSQEPRQLSKLSPHVRSGVSIHQGAKADKNRSMPKLSRDLSPKQVSGYCTVSSLLALPSILHPVFVRTAVHVRIPTSQLNLGYPCGESIQRNLGSVWQYKLEQHRPIFV